MMPIAWVESAGFGIKDTDFRDVLRHTWQVVYRCSGCSTLDTRRLLAQVLSMSGNPADVDAEAVAAALVELITDHRCPKKVGS